MRTAMLMVVMVCACGPKQPLDVGTGASSREHSDAPPASSGSDAAAAVSAPSAVPDAAPPPSPVAVADAAPPDQCGGTAGPFEMKVRPEVKKCFYATLKTTPTLSGNVHIGVAIDMQGKMGAVQIAEAQEIGKDGVACMTKAIKAEPFDGSGCKGKSLTFAQLFGAAAR